MLKGCMMEHYQALKKKTKRDGRERKIQQVVNKWK